MWEVSKNIIYKSTVKNSQMQSCQEALTRNCATKAGTYQASPKISHQGPRIPLPSICDG